MLAHAHSKLRAAARLDVELILFNYVPELLFKIHYFCLCHINVEAI